MQKNFIAIDYGTKKSGIAYSVMGFCFALNTILTKEIFEILPQIIEEKKPEKIIIGMPYNIDGSISTHAKRVQRFAIELEKIISIPVVLHDERLTTSEARIYFEESGIKGDLDAESARLILEDYLESI